MGGLFRAKVVVRLWLLVELQLAQREFRVAHCWDPRRDLVSRVLDYSRRCGVRDGGRKARRRGWIGGRDHRRIQAGARIGIRVSHPQGWDSQGDVASRVWDDRCKSRRRDLVCGGDRRRESVRQGRSLSQSRDVRTRTLVVGIRVDGREGGGWRHRRPELAAHHRRVHWHAVLAPRDHRALAPHPQDRLVSGRARQWAHRADAGR
mmetsp:Transcript_58354/g.136971  ORF Transcript_58354/g.136971 Transcript_58354/m.136971 type:complete len:205 (+) Transcript_58354:1470-2084(+)